MLYNIAKNKKFIRDSLKEIPQSIFVDKIFLSKISIFILQDFRMVGINSEVQSPAYDILWTEENKDKEAFFLIFITNNSDPHSLIIKLLIRNVCSNP